MLRDEFAQIMKTYGVDGLLTIIFQHAADKEVAEYKFKITHLEAEVKRLLSPGLITKNPYTAELSKNAYEHGYKDGQRSLMKPERPQTYKDLTDVEIINVYEQSHNLLRHNRIRDVIAADRAKQREVKPEPVTVTGRWWQSGDKNIWFLHPERYETHQKVLDGNPGTCRWLSDEQTIEFPNA